MTKHGNSKIQLGISLSRHRDKTGLVKLGLDHVSGAFILWGIGILIAIIIFIIESVHYHCKRKSKMIRYH